MLDYLVPKERLVYSLAKCFQAMTLLLQGFDEPGNGNQEAGCSPLCPDSSETRCRSRSAYT